MAGTAPTDLDKKAATLLIGVDTLFGGDALHESGMYHMIADTWFSDAPAPEIYYDNFAQTARDSARDKPGTPDVLADQEAVRRFVDKYGLRDLAPEIRRDSSSISGDEQTNILDLTNALDIMLNEFLAKTSGERAPSFDEKYLAAAGGAVSGVRIADPGGARELLRKTLDDAGYKVSGSRDLRETFLAWKSAQTPLDPSQVGDIARKIDTELLQVMRGNVFTRLNFRITGYLPDLSDVAFDGHRFETIDGADFTGSSIYRGGEKDGKPALIALFEYNTDHPITLPKLYHLCAHEVIGHYINAAVQDILWRDGRLGFTATMGTMCTPDVAFQEGWAQNIFEVLYGSRESAAEAHGKDLLVALAHADLEDFGKNNASILYQREGKGLDEVRRHIAEDCVQPDEIVKKLSGSWAQHNIIGPMYGPAYLIGRETVNAAIQEHGTIPVAGIGYHLSGQADIRTFQDKAGRL